MDDQIPARITPQVKIKDAWDFFCSSLRHLKLYLSLATTDSRFYLTIYYQMLFLTALGCDGPVTFDSLKPLIDRLRLIERVAESLWGEGGGDAHSYEYMAWQVIERYGEESWKEWIPEFVRLEKEGRVVEKKERGLQALLETLSRNPAPGVSTFPFLPLYLQG